MPLHGKASESLTCLLETFHAAHATKKAVAEMRKAPVPLIKAAAELGDGSPVISACTPLREAKPVAGSYISDSSFATVEEPEQDPDCTDVFGQVGLNPPRHKERLTSVSSELSVVSNTTVIWVGSLTPALGQAGPSGMNVQAGRPPSEITVDWQESGARAEELAPGDTSPLSISPGSLKSSMHLKTPGQSGMPSPNVEIYATGDTPGIETGASPFHSTHLTVEGKRPQVTTEGSERQEKKDIIEGAKKDERPVVPFYYGSKIPVKAAKSTTAVGKRNTYGSLIANQRRMASCDSISTSPQTSTPKPHQCAATPLVAPKMRSPKRSATSPARILTRKDVISGHFPSTPPRSPSIIQTSGGGSPRPRSSSKIPIPTPTPPRVISEGRKLNEYLGFAMGESLLSDIVEGDCETEAIWERRRDDVMGPLGVSPTTRLGGFVRPGSLTKKARVQTMPMGSLVGAAMASNDNMKS